jgi:hypothetical protein
MKKLVLCGAAFAALMIGPAPAADLTVRPVDRTPQTVYVNPFPAWNRTPVVVAGTRRGDMCWVDGFLFGYWRPCPPAVRAARSGAERTARSQRTTRAARTDRMATAPVCTASEPKKEYWATSLSGAVERGLMTGLQDAIARGEVAWLDINQESPVPETASGINLIYYHVGGNCYVGRDCDRFPSSKPTGDRWGEQERAIDLTDPQARKIVVEDMIRIVRQADEKAAKGATIGIHLDNVHSLDADGLAKVFNEYLQGVEAAKQQGLISKTRTVGYVAKNNPAEFKKALDQRLLRTPPLYQIVENATLSQTGALDDNSRAAQELGRRYAVPVFLMAFGSDVAYTIEQGGTRKEVYVTQDMARRMAGMANISGAAWSPDESRYHPTVFVQGSPVRQMSRSCDKVAGAEEPPASAASDMVPGQEPRERAAGARPHRPAVRVERAAKPAPVGLFSSLFESRPPVSPVRTQRLARSRT